MERGPSTPEQAATSQRGPSGALGNDGAGGVIVDGGSLLIQREVEEEDPLVEDVATETRPLPEGLNTEVDSSADGSSHTHLYRVSRYYCQRLHRAMEEFVEKFNCAPLDEVLFYRQEREGVKPAAENTERKTPSNHFLKMLKERDEPVGEAMVGFLARLHDSKQELHQILQDMKIKEDPDGTLRGDVHGSRVSPEDEISQGEEGSLSGGTEALRNKRRLLNTMHFMSETGNAGLLRMGKVTLGDCKDPGKALRLCPLDCCVLASAIRPLGIVEELNVTHCSIQAEGIRQLSSVLHLCKTLRLSWNQLGDSGVKLLCSSLRQPGCEIQELWLDYNGLTAAGTRDLASAVGGNRSLEQLSLNHNELGAAAVKQLSEALRRPTCRLRHLRLCGTGITNAYCRQLAWALCTNRSLTALDLDNNQLGDSGVIQLCGALVKPDCKIQALRLGSTRLTGLCTLELMNALNINRSLRQLNLSYNRLGLPGVQRLSAALKRPGCRIQKLELDENGLRDACAEELASALSTNQSLRGLYLNRNSFTDRSIPAFHRLARSCSSLRFIWLWRNQFSPEGRENLQSMKESAHRVTVFV
uniref:ribonuclease inhibitor-like isoform X2 n=1 Tax=Pristiophorus japonicus TaxID=55135 RepID=UPI00398EF60A